MHFKNQIQPINTVFFAVLFGFLHWTCMQYVSSDSCQSLIQVLCRRKSTNFDAIISLSR